MGVQTVTLQLSKTTYDQIRRAAEKTERPFNDVLTEAVSAVAPVVDAPAQLRSSLAHMAYLNDAALWQAARATLPNEHRQRLEWLHNEQQQRELTIVEQEEEQALMKLYRETILVRAQAAVLLKQRNYDISNLNQFM